jgi:hypothetical protein
MKAQDLTELRNDGDWMRLSKIGFTASGAKNELVKIKD